jgi:hypothetical protein
MFVDRTELVQALQTYCYTNLKTFKGLEETTEALRFLLILFISVSPCLRGFLPLHIFLEILYNVAG